MSLVTFLLTSIVTIGVTLKVVEPDRVILSTVIVSSKPIDVSEDVKRDDWDITYKDVSLKNPLILEYEIKNEGKISLEKKDFGEPIIFYLPKSVNIVSNELDKNWEVSASKDEVNIIKISLLEGKYFNHGSTITFKLYVDDLKGELDPIRDISTTVNIKNMIENTLKPILGAKSVVRKKSFFNINNSVTFPENIQGSI